MRAFVFNGPNEMKYQEVKEPKILDPSDAVIRVCFSSVCGMDVKIMKGFLPEVCPGTIPGHEFCGIVEETGSGVKNFKRGDRVAVSAITSCGFCEKCVAGESENCLNGGWLLGYLIDGCQAQFARVPFADRSLTKVPGNMNLKDAVFAGDVALAGYQAVVNAEIKKGDTVFVLGSGPAACIAMMCARKYEPSTIVAIDRRNERLNKIEKFKVADKVIDIDGKNISEEIKKMTSGKKADVVIEGSGRNEFFDAAIDISDKSGVVSVLSVYPKPLIFSTERIENRRFTLKTTRVEENAVSDVIGMIAAGFIDTAFLCSGEGGFNELDTGYKMVERKKSGFFKWVCVH